VALKGKAPNCIFPFTYAMLSRNCATRFGRVVRVLLSPPFLGFPWILSSETRLINGLFGINRQKFFVTLLSVAAAAPQRRSHSCHADKQDRSSGKLTLISDFCRPSRSTRHGQSKAAASSAEFYQAPPKRSWSRRPRGRSGAKFPISLPIHSTRALNLLVARLEARDGLTEIIAALTLQTFP
jgi:hypothetical protein